MKLLIASLTNETNTFAPFPVGRAAFENLMVTRQATREPAVAASTPLHIWREMGEAKGWEVAESLLAWAQPSGMVVRGVYETYRDEILPALPPDKRYVGAMVANALDIAARSLAEG